MQSTAHANLNLGESSLHRCANAFIDKRGDAILVRLLTKKREQDLMNMYMAYRPRNSFNGLPPETDEACVAWARNLIEAGINVVALSFDSGLVGHTALFAMPGGICELLAVVTPTHQRIGIGTQMTRCAIQLAYELGFERVWLSVEARNHIARHVYSKCGFHYESEGKADELCMSFDMSRYYATVNTPVSAVMNRKALSIGLRQTCRDAATLCMEHHIAALPVVDSDNRVVGIISQTDLISFAGLSHKVSDVLTREVVTLHEETPISQAVRLFQSRRLRYMPVIDADGKLIGIVGRRDIMGYFIKTIDARTAS